MAQKEYTGPTGLATSRYASPVKRNAALAAFPSAAAAPNNAAVASEPANAMATREQSATTISGSVLDKVPQNADAELAVAQSNASKQEVDRHAAQLSTTVSSAFLNTRQLLGLIRESMQKENPADLQTVEEMWVQLEQLFHAANEANGAPPTLFEKQRNNMSLYHASMMNETIRETQEELNIQHKKVNIQHSLILEHQEAFQIYKSQTSAKLRELEGIQERVSRLTLENGNFRTEIDKYKQLLEKEMSTKADDVQKADALQKELEQLVASKSRLLSEAETLRSTLSDLQEKMKAMEQQITDRFTAQLQAKADELAKETHKSTNLKALIKTIEGREGTARMEVDKIKLENKALNEKYTAQAVEHAQAFTKLNEQTKKIEALATNVKRFEDENKALKQQVTKLPEVEKQNAELVRAKADLNERVNRLTTDLSTVSSERSLVRTELQALTEKAKKLDEEVENLELENNALLTKVAENKKASQDLATYKAENLKLKTTVDELRAGGAAPTTGGPPASGKEVKALEEKIRGLEEQKALLQTSLQEWADIAKRSYDEYKEMLPRYKQGEQHRKDALEKEEEIKSLKLQLSTAKASQSSGVGADGDGAYWKAKYEFLLSTVGG